MYSSEAYKIDLKGLKDGVSSLEYHLDDSYFAALAEENEGLEVSRGCVDVALNINKVAETFDVTLRVAGKVVIPCNVCLDDMEQPIEASYKLVVKLGEEESDEGDIITVAADEAIWDISWLIYEYVDLAIPVRHVHAPGKCNPVMMKMLGEHSATRSGGEDTAEADIDPRWNALKNLKI
jgi:uncharacterized metal-binding protein YceD (DUF177 family)